MEGRAGLAVQFVGAGDAFGSGGRFQACISLRASTTHVLLDCGATSLVAMKRLGVDPGSVDAVMVTHLHGDHFGGLPFLILDGQFSRRERPLTVVGPPGTRDRVLQAMDVFFPGSSAVPRRFEMHFLELPARRETGIGALAVTAFEVPHPSGAPAYALRVRLADRTIGYSGDGGWSEALVDAADGADLFICEAYSFDKPIRFHLSYAELMANRDRLRCRQLVLTHLGADMLAHADDTDVDAAHDGLTLSI
ncbi:MAG: MBL fold metallo-hydrolase [Chloroflexota bacterium]|nr:MBL fold metallo-hydrolase [Chloroflexota bacterium]